MAGNTRGKIKEHLEGVHRNCDWSRVHLQKTIILIQEHNPQLVKAVKALGELVDLLDKANQNIYAKI